MVCVSWLPCVRGYEHTGVGALRTALRIRAAHSPRRRHRPPMSGVRPVHLGTCV